MIHHPLGTTERISLITDIFSDRDEAKTVKRLRGNDAQSFIDVVDEVLPHFFYLNRLRQFEISSPIDVG